MAHQGVDPIVGFWDLFRGRADDLARVHSADEPVYGELLHKLQEIDSGLYLEFCSVPGERELIVTSEGERELFDLARSVVSKAPDVPGWKITALKPKLGFPESVCWEGLSLQTDAVKLQILGREPDGRLAIRAFVPDLADEDSDDACEAILRAIDHGLGEERHAETVGYVDVASLPSDADDRLLPLVELDRIVDLC